MFISKLPVCLFVLLVPMGNQSQTWLGLSFILPQPMNELWSKGWNEQALIAHMSFFCYKCSENWECEEKKCSEVIMVDNKLRLLLLLTIAMSSKYLYCRSFWVAQIEISQLVSDRLLKIFPSNIFTAKSDFLSLYFFQYK